MFLSVPVGKTERVCFNAHRIFNPMTIIEELYPEMRLLEFACIHIGKITSLDFRNNSNYLKMKNVIEEYTIKMLGEYDCGVFLFERC